MRLGVLIIFSVAVLTCQGGHHFKRKFAKSLETFPKKSVKGPSQETGEIHAVLIAGSRGLGNYRHQANVAHAYHVLLGHGVSADNIVVLMYDDVANDPGNPFPGQLFNVPDGPDVYKGLKIDYRAEDVTIPNFINVLKGNESGVTNGTGRVLTSGPNDRVFVYFTDHGNTGVIAFPNDEPMTAKELNDTLIWMYENSKFAQLTFYLEACFSGSMFENILPENINIYAITAANASQSANLAYCGIPKYNSICLSDEFSAAWMGDSDKEDLQTETLDEQYEIVKNKVNDSQVLRFGNLTIAEEPVGLFQGDQKSDQIAESPPEAIGISVPAPDAELFYLSTLLKNTINEEEVASLTGRINEIHRTRLFTKIFSRTLVKKLVADPAQHEHILEAYEPITDLECHHRVVKSFGASCPRLAKNPDGLGVIHVLSNLCAVLGDANIIVDALKEKCAKFRLNEN